MENAEENDLEDEDVDTKRGVHEDVESICYSHFLAD